VLGKAKHIELGCEEGHRKCVERDALERALLGQGQWLRKAALGVDAEKAKVWFRNAGNEELCVLMPLDTYRAFPLLSPVTLLQFEQFAGREFEAVAS
jgi:hypothetical protein